MHAPRGPPTYVTGQNFLSISAYIHYKHVISGPNRMLITRVVCSRGFEVLVGADLPTNRGYLAASGLQCPKLHLIPAYRPRNYSNLEGLLPAHDDCIRVLYPNQANQISIPNFVNLDDEVMEDPVDDLETQIIGSYQPVL